MQKKVFLSVYISKIGILQMNDGKLVKNFDIKAYYHKYFVIKGTFVIYV